MARPKITLTARRALAERHGVPMDGIPRYVPCAYCGDVGTVTYWPPGTFPRFTGQWTLGLFHPDTQRIMEPTPASWVTSTLEYDHVEPLQRGGLNAADNLVFACQPCNISKGTRSLNEWVDWLASKRGRRSKVNRLAILQRFGIEVD